MIHLYKTQNGIWDDYGPKHAAEYAVNDKKDTAYHVNKADFAYVFQYET